MTKKFVCPKCQQTVMFPATILPEWVPTCYHTLEAAQQGRGGIRMIEVVNDEQLQGRNMGGTS